MKTNLPNKPPDNNRLVLVWMKAAVNPILCRYNDGKWWLDYIQFQYVQTGYEKYTSLVLTHPQYIIAWQECPKRP